LTSCRRSDGRHCCFGAPEIWAQKNRLAGRFIRKALGELIMTNIIPLRNTGGFTRMDNNLYEALIGAELSGRELRVALAIHRQTAGYNIEHSRIAASVVAEMSGIRREHVSRIISELLRQRVLYRVGGSKGPLGVSPANEWRIDSKDHGQSKELKAAQSAISGTSLVPFPAHYKDRNTNTTSNEVVDAPAPVKAKRERKPSFGKPQLLANNPYQIPDQLLTDWLALRKTKRAAVSQTVWDALNAELAKCADLGISAVTAMTEALSAGWHGFKADWIANRLAQAGRTTTAAAGPDFYSTDWRSDTSDDL
jgi:phage replication O-like protein O